MIDGSHVFTLSKQFGPFICEQDDCHKPAWSVVMTDEEYATIPEGICGEELAVYIIHNHLGKHTCKSCIKALVEKC